MEILFVPGANPPIAYVTNIYGGTLWTATCNPTNKDFDVAQAHDLATQKVGVPLEISFNTNERRPDVRETAKPGHLHVFDVANPGKSDGSITVIDLKSVDASRHWKVDRAESNRTVRTQCPSVDSDQCRCDSRR